MRKRIMISQAMNGLDDATIQSIRDRAVAYLEDLGYEVLDTFFKDYHIYDADEMKKNGVKQIPVFYLSHSIEFMSKCDAVYFCNGWQHARGCNIEHEIAVQYGLEIIYENPPEVQSFAQKPIVVSAMQWKGLQVEGHKKHMLQFTKGHADIRQLKGDGEHEHSWKLCVHSPMGMQIASVGDFVIECRDGSFCVMKEDLFYKTYDLTPEQVAFSEYEDIDS